MGQTCPMTCGLSRNLEKSFSRKFRGPYIRGQTLSHDMWALKVSTMGQGLPPLAFVYVESTLLVFDVGLLFALQPKVHVRCSFRVFAVFSVQFVCVFCMI